MTSDDMSDSSLDEDDFNVRNMNFPGAEVLFLTAVRDGDIGYVESALENKENPLNINIRNAEKLSPLSIAVKSGHKLIVQQLLKHGCLFDDSLLRAVDSEFFDAVLLICKYAELQGPDILQKVLGGRCEGDEYHPEITAIMLACHSANYNIIKLLLGYGARVPDPNSADMQRTELHTLQHSVGILNIYRAHSCGLYIAMTSSDPIATAFSLGEQLQKLSISEYEFRQEYNSLLDDVEQFAADMLGQARNSKELEVIMRHCTAVTEDNDEEEDSNKSTPERLGQAIDLDQKKFVAHPHCQQLLMNKFYGSINRHNTVRYWALLLLTTFGYPLLSVAFIVFPTKPLAAFLKIPKVKFQMDVGSRLTFLLLLFIISSNVPDKEPCLVISNMHVSLLFLLMIWIAGRTLVEICCVIRDGPGHLMNLTSIFDNIILLLYWTCLILSFISLSEINCSSQLRKRRNSEPYRSIGTYLLPEINKSMMDAIQNTKIEIQQKFERQLLLIEENLNIANNPTEMTGIDDNSWKENWAMATFALATTASIIRLLVLTLSSQFIGPLQISLGGMFNDIVKFIVVFIVVWAAFAIGLNTLFSIYEAANTELCQQTSNCRPGPFSSVSSSMEILFWSLFGLVDLEMLNIIPEDHTLTRQLARIMFGTYMMVAVVVMLNALIAMMSNTYTRVDENSDTEWKFARSKMWISFLKPQGTVPPPFNLVPGVEDFKIIRKYFAKKCCRKGRNAESDRLRQQGKERFEEHFSKVLKEFVERYIVEQTSVGSDTAAEVTRKDIMSIRTDVAIFKYEALKSLKVTNNIFHALSVHLDTTKGKLTPVDLANKTAILISSKIRESKKDTRDRCEKIVEYINEYGDEIRSKLGIKEEKANKKKTEERDSQNLKSAVQSGKLNLDISYLRQTEGDKSLPANRNIKEPNDEARESGNESRLLNENTDELQTEVIVHSPIHSINSTLPPPRL